MLVIKIQPEWDMEDIIKIIFILVNENRVKVPQIIDDRKIRVIVKNILNFNVI